MRLIGLVAALLLMILCIPVALAECGYGERCQGVPFRIDPLPRLQSPTPFPTSNATTIPTETPTSSGSGSVTTPTTIGVGGLGDQVSTLQAIINTTPVGINAIAPTLSLSDLGENSATFFGYMRGLTAMNLGYFQPLVNFFFGALVLIIATILITNNLPLIAAIIGVIRKVIQLILDFLPL
jgi:hypothetical protein